MARIVTDSRTTPAETKAITMPTGTPFLSEEVSPNGTSLVIFSFIDVMPVDTRKGNVVLISIFGVAVGMTFGVGEAIAVTVPLAA